MQSGELDAAISSSNWLFVTGITRAGIAAGVMTSSGIGLASKNSSIVETLYGSSAKCMNCVVAHDPEPRNITVSFRSTCG